MANYMVYYENQMGSKDIRSFLGGLFRRALPILTRGFKAVGKEALRSGVYQMT